jgi:hypothetical protein
MIILLFVSLSACDNRSNIYITQVPTPTQSTSVIISPMVLETPEPDLRLLIARSKPNSEFLCGQDVLGSDIWFFDDPTRPGIRILNDPETG